MVNIFVQNLSLKFAWFNRLLSDTVNIQFWSVHLHHCFVIPLCDVLICDLKHKDLSVLFRPGVNSLPPFWMDVFVKWFQHFFVLKDCITDMDRSRALSLPIIYKSAVVADQAWTSWQVHNTLQEHNLLLLEPFLVHFVTIFQMIRIVDPAMAGLIAQLRAAVP